jgi:hypothetical protein
MLTYRDDGDVARIENHMPRDPQRYQKQHHSKDHELASGTHEDSYTFPERWCGNGGEGSPPFPDGYLLAGDLAAVALDLVGAN